MLNPVVIVVAMNSELIQLARFLPGFEPSVDKHYQVWINTLNEQRIVMIQSGIGLTNAAAAATYAALTWEPKAMLNYGCAGAHRRDLFPGDVVVGTSAFNQGRFRFASDGSRSLLGFESSHPGDTAYKHTYPCDENLIDIALGAARDISLEPWPEHARLKGQNGRTQVVSGALATGDIWIQNPDMIDEVHGQFDSQCEDMEASAIGQIACQFGIPWLAIKDISNSEFHEQTIFDGADDPLPTEEVGKRAAQVMAATIQRLVSP